MVLNRYLAMVSVGMLVCSAASLFSVPFTPSFMQIANPALWFVSGSSWLLIPKSGFHKIVGAIASFLALWWLSLWILRQSILPLPAAGFLQVALVGVYCLGVCLLIREKTARGFLVVQHACIVFIAVMGVILQARGISTELAADETGRLAARGLFYSPVFVNTAMAAGILRPGLWSKAVILFSLMQLGGSFASLWGHFGLDWTLEAAIALWASSAVGFLYIGIRAVVKRTSSA